MNGGVVIKENTQLSSLPSHSGVWTQQELRVDNQDRTVALSLGHCKVSLGRLVARCGLNQPVLGVTRWLRRSDPLGPDGGRDLIRLNTWVILKSCPGRDGQVEA